MRNIFAIFNTPAYAHPSNFPEMGDIKTLINRWKFEIKTRRGSGVMTVCILSFFLKYLKVKLLGGAYTVSGWCGFDISETTSGKVAKWWRKTSDCLILGGSRSLKLHILTILWSYPWSPWPLPKCPNQGTHSK